MPTDIFSLPLSEIKELVFSPCGFELTNVVKEPESADYSAHKFELDDRKILFRTAKVTPTKTGQFVTLWKRSAKGPIQPYDFEDDVDLVVINVKTQYHFGQFVFPRTVLMQCGVFSTETKEGKRAIRVYAPWDKAENKQAKASQKWQLEYFLEIPFDRTIDVHRAKFLYQNA